MSEADCRAAAEYLGIVVTAGTTTTTRPLLTSPHQTTTTPTGDGGRSPRPPALTMTIPKPTAAVKPNDDGGDIAAGTSVPSPRPPALAITTATAIEPHFHRRDHHHHAMSPADMLEKLHADLDGVVDPDDLEALALADHPDELEAFAAAINNEIRLRDDADELRVRRSGSGSGAGSGGTGTPGSGQEQLGCGHRRGELTCGATIVGDTGTECSTHVFSLVIPEGGENQTGTGRQVRIISCGSMFDTRLALYNGTVIGPNTLLDDNDDGCGAQAMLDPRTLAPGTCESPNPTRVVCCHGRRKPAACLLACCFPVFAVVAACTLALGVVSSRVPISGPG